MARPSGITLALLCMMGTATAAPDGEPRHAPTAAAPDPTKLPPKPSYLSMPSDFMSTPAYRYGQLSRAECETELTNRQIAFVRQPAAAVGAPVRLVGPLNGVLFRTDQSEKERATSPFEIADCRLVLALADFTEVLRSLDIVEVRHYSMYRLPPDDWPKKQSAPQHFGAMALDAGVFIAKDGSTLNVDRDFNGAIGARTCGVGAAPKPVTPAAKKLRALLCSTVERRLFNVVLTPNYNPPHKNHFHLEVTAGAKWFIVN